MGMPSGDGGASQDGGVSGDASFGGDGGNEGSAFPTESFDTNTGDVRGGGGGLQGASGAPRSGGGEGFGAGGVACLVAFGLRRRRRAR